MGMEKHVFGVILATYVTVMPYVYSKEPFYCLRPSAGTKSCTLCARKMVTKPCNLLPSTQQYYYDCYINITIMQPLAHYLCIFQSYMILYYRSYLDLPALMGYYFLSLSKIRKPIPKTN